MCVYILLACGCSRSRYCFITRALAWAVHLYRRSDLQHTHTYTYKHSSAPVNCIAADILNKEIELNLFTNFACVCVCIYTPPCCPFFLPSLSEAWNCIIQRCSAYMLIREDALFMVARETARFLYSMCICVCIRNREQGSFLLLHRDR